MTADQSKSVVLSCGQQNISQNKCAIADMEHHDLFGGALYLFVVDGKIQFAFLETEFDVSKLQIPFDGVIVSFNIVEISQDLTTGNFKIIALDEQYVFENYDPLLDNSKLLKEYNAKTFILSFN